MSAPGWAELSPCGTYRYLLGRRVGQDPRTALFIMLNPSTANATIDDATIRRCKAFAHREGCGTLEVVNLFALRATNPAALLQASDPVGPANDHYIGRALERAALVVVAWGAINGLSLVERSWRIGRGIQIRLAGDDSRGPFCLGRTASGAPRHPLYVKGDTPLEPWWP